MCMKSHGHLPPCTRTLWPATQLITPETPTSSRWQEATIIFGSWKITQGRRDVFPKVHQLKKGLWINWEPSHSSELVALQQSARRASRQSDELSRGASFCVTWRFPQNEPNHEVAGNLLNRVSAAAKLRSEKCTARSWQSLLTWEEENARFNQIPAGYQSGHSSGCKQKKTLSCCYDNFGTKVVLWEVLRLKRLKRLKKHNGFCRIKLRLNIDAKLCQFNRRVVATRTRLVFAGPFYGCI